MVTNKHRVIHLQAALVRPRMQHTLPELVYIPQGLEVSELIWHSLTLLENMVLI